MGYSKKYPIILIMKLRENQVIPVEKGIEFFRQKKSEPSIIVAPTAFGKSVVIASIAKEVGERLLIIQPSKELLEQNYNKFIGSTA
jgi:DNA repair protein RadD